MRSKLIIGILLFGVTLAVFWQAGSHQFVNFDDPAYVSNNPFSRSGFTLESIAWAFGAFYAYNWHPLTWLSHMADVQLFGLAPAGHHLMSVFLHAANVVLLFLLLSRTTKATWRSAVVALFFALHPLHVESVLWVAERKDVLSTFFALLTLHLYAGYAEERKSWRYLAVLGCYALGLMAKPMLVPLPCVMLLLDYWPLDRLELRKRQESGTAGCSQRLPVLRLL
jgi:protein O-mannosyl-transferase